MAWLKNKIFGKKPSSEEEFASNLYEALVLGGGPSAESDTHLDMSSLEIPTTHLQRFAEKRLITLEAFLFVATQIATTESLEQEDQPFAPVTPLALEMGKLIQRKWAERGIKLDSAHTVAEKCFGEIEVFLDRPFKWGRNWLDEFYRDKESAGEHYIMWTDQCLKEFKAMKMVVEQFL